MLVQRPHKVWSRGEEARACDLATDPLELAPLGDAAVVRRVRGADALEPRAAPWPGAVPAPVIDPELGAELDALGYAGRR